MKLELLFLGICAIVLGAMFIMAFVLNVAGVM